MIFRNTSFTPLAGSRYPSIGSVSFDKPPARRFYKLYHIVFFRTSGDFVFDDLDGMLNIKSFDKQDPVDILDEVDLFAGKSPAAHPQGIHPGIGNRLPCGLDIGWYILAHQRAATDHHMFTYTDKLVYGSQPPYNGMVSHLNMTGQVDIIS